MPCFRPLQGWWERAAPKNGKRRVVFDKSDSCGHAITLPCGQCIGCRLERSRQWAMRVMHEAAMHEDNCFITLTYDDEHLPEDGSLNKKHYQDFMKRLRRRFEPRKIRFFHCGEYGSNFGRPHYHACLFNCDFPDKRFLRQAGDSSLYESDLLAEIWGHGFVTLGDVTFESAAYVARYVMKKVTGDDAAEHYKAVDKETGEIKMNDDGSIFLYQPEYLTMSLKPGIGAGWFQKFTDDVFPSDEVIVRGHPSRPPRYYADMYENMEPEAHKQLKQRRLNKAAEYAENNTPDRLYVREKVTEARVKFLKRGLEDEA